MAEWELDNCFQKATVKLDKIIKKSNFRTLEIDQKCSTNWEKHLFMEKLVDFR